MGVAVGAGVATYEVRLPASCSDVALELNNVSRSGKGRVELSESEESSGRPTWGICILEQFQFFGRTN